MKVFLIIFIFFLGKLYSQSGLDPEVLKKYPFIKADSSHIHNDSSLKEFYGKLFALNKSGQGRVNVIHIGDSHIQADFLSGIVRLGLQQKFGNAGRGLIFPYRLANKSNEPKDYKTSSNVVWEYKRNVFMNQPLPIGVSGYTIQTSDTGAMITVSVKATDTMDYSVNKLTLFHEKAENQFDFAVYDSSMNEIGYIKTTAKSENNFTSVFKFPKAVVKFIIKPCPRDSLQNCARIYGMLLENERHGLLYHMIGVNGAEYQHYNSSAYFFTQMKYLKPDLVIVSLGTNEAFNYKGFTSAGFYASIDTLVTRIRQNNPGVNILLTTPADSYKRSGRRGRVKNPVVKEVVATIKQYANDKSIAYWDLFETTGGWNSMAKWYAAGMADRARIHFSRKGYEIQGALLTDALLEGYQHYLKLK